MGMQTEAAPLLSDTGSLADVDCSEPFKGGPSNEGKKIWVHSVCEKTVLFVAA